MLTRIIASTFALALVAATGCNKADNNSAAGADAKSAAKSDDGKSCPHAKGKHAGKKHGDKMHGDKMHAMHGDKIDPAEHAAKLAEKLGLNAEQTSAAQALFVEVEPQLTALRESTLAIHKDMQALHGKDKQPDAKLIEAKKAEFAQVKADKIKIHEELSAKLDAILTPEQRVAHAELMKEHHGGKAGKHDCGGDCAHGDKAGGCGGDCGGDCAHGDKAGKPGCGGDCAHGDKAGKHGDCGGDCAHGDKKAAHGDKAAAHGKAGAHACGSDCACNKK